MVIFFLGYIDLVIFILKTISDNFRFFPHMLTNHLGELKANSLVWYIKPPSAMI